MSKIALYRKYRSTSFNQILGQDHIVNTLKKAVDSGAVSHAYLFTGPRGVGKTSIARLLAHRIIGVDYAGDSVQHIDIIEIDAASNTGVDDVRELREKAYISPAQASYKIYIIDEVHMLSKAAFNALLKILEEPPAHVIFILATTEAHKVPETVASRTQRFGFRPIPKSLLTKHLLEIAQKESIAIESDAAEDIASYSNGSFRDAISLLDQLQHIDGTITKQAIRQSIGQLDDARLTALTKAIANNSAPEIITALEESYLEGAQPVEIAQQLARHLRESLIGEQKLLTQENLIKLIEKLLEVGQSSDPELFLEVTLIKTINPSLRTQENPVAKPEVEIIDQTPEVVYEITPKPRNLASSVTIDETGWNSVLDRVKTINNSIFALLRMCHMTSDNQIIHLTFGFPFHYRRMLENQNQDALQKALSDEFGRSFELKIALDENSKKPIPEVSKKPDISSDIIEVLGGEMVSL